MGSSQIDPRNGEYERLLHSLYKNMGRHTIVLSILLVVTYWGCLHPPRPLDGNPATAQNYSIWQDLFFCFNAFAFLFSVCGVFIMSGSLNLFPITPASRNISSPTDKEMTAQLKLLAAILPAAIYITMLAALALMCCAVAYLFAGLATVGGMEAQPLALIIPCSLSGFVFLQAFLLFLRDAFKFWREICFSNDQVWVAMKGETIVGNKFGRVLDYVCESASNSPPEQQKLSERSQENMV